MCFTAVLLTVYRRLNLSLPLVPIMFFKHYPQKNEDGILPLMETSDASYGLIGSDANTTYTAGSGSGSVTTNKVVSPLSEFTSRGLNVEYNDGVNVTAAVALAAEVSIPVRGMSMCYACKC